MSRYINLLISDKKSNVFIPFTTENLFVVNTRQTAIPEFYNINKNGGSLPTCMQGTKNEIPGIYMDPLNNGQPSQNLTIPALFPAQGKFSLFGRFKPHYQSGLFLDGSPVLCGGQQQWLGGGLPGFNKCLKYDVNNDNWTEIGTTRYYG